VSAAVAHVDELDRLPTAWGGVWRPVRRRFDVGAFGVNAWTTEAAGDHVIERHGEADGPEELYVVLAGRATFTLGDETVDEGRAHLRRTIDRYPDLWHPSYNAACFESIAGDADTALDHLRAAVDRAGDDARRAAREDPDFDPIRDDERFKELIA
jgi:hypothetical protein